MFYRLKPTCLALVIVSVLCTVADAKTKDSQDDQIALQICSDYFGEVSFQDAGSFHEAIADLTAGQREKLAALIRRFVDLVTFEPSTNSEIIEQFKAESVEDLPWSSFTDLLNKKDWRPLIAFVKGEKLDDHSPEVAHDEETENLEKNAMEAMEEESVLERMEEGMMKIEPESIRMEVEQTESITREIQGENSEKNSEAGSPAYGYLRRTVNDGLERENKKADFWRRLVGRDRSADQDIAARAGTELRHYLSIGDFESATNVEVGPMNIRELFRHTRQGIVELRQLESELDFVEYWKEQAERDPNDEYLYDPEDPTDAPPFKKAVRDSQALAAYLEQAQKRRDELKTKFTEAYPLYVKIHRFMSRALLGNGDIVFKARIMQFLTMLGEHAEEVRVATNTRTGLSERRTDFLREKLNFLNLDEISVHLSNAIRDSASLSELAQHHRSYEYLRSYINVATWQNLDSVMDELGVTADYRQQMKRFQTKRERQRAWFRIRTGKFALDVIDASIKSVSSKLGKHGINSIPLLRSLFKEYQRDAIRQDYYPPLFEMVDNELNIEQQLKVIAGLGSEDPRYYTAMALYPDLRLAVARMENYIRPDDELTYAYANVLKGLEEGNAQAELLGNAVSPIIDGGTAARKVRNFIIYTTVLTAAGLTTGTAVAAFMGADLSSVNWLWNWLGSSGFASATTAVGQVISSNPELAAQAAELSKLGSYLW